MEEENCHFVYKHLWSPLKAPCSLGRLSPRRAQALECRAKPGVVEDRVGAAPPPPSQLCLWPANSLGSIQSVYLTLQRCCHGASSVYLGARTNQERCQNVGLLISPRCSLMAPSLSVPARVGDKRFMAFWRELFSWRSEVTLWVRRLTECRCLLTSPPPPPSWSSPNSDITGFGLRWTRLGVLGGHQNPLLWDQNLETVLAKLSRLH